MSLKSEELYLLLSQLCPLNAVQSTLQQFHATLTIQEKEDVSDVKY